MQKLSCNRTCKFHRKYFEYLHKWKKLFEIIVCIFFVCKILNQTLEFPGHCAVLPEQVLSSKSFRSPRQLQLTLPSEVSKHRSWQPPLLMRHRENSPLKRWASLGRLARQTSSILTHRETHQCATNTHTRIHMTRQTDVPAWMWQWLCLQRIHISMWLDLHGIWRYYCRL